MLWVSWWITGNRWPINQPTVMSMKRSAHERHWISHLRNHKASFLMRHPQSHWSVKVQSCYTSSRWIFAHITFVPLCPSPCGETRSTVAYEQLKCYKTTQSSSNMLLLPWQFYISLMSSAGGSSVYLILIDADVFKISDKAQPLLDSPVCCLHSAVQTYLNYKQSTAWNQNTSHSTIYKTITWHWVAPDQAPVDMRICFYTELKDGTLSSMTYGATGNNY